MAFVDMRMKMREERRGWDTMPYSHEKPPRGLLLARAIDNPMQTPRLYSNQPPPSVISLLPNVGSTVGLFYT